MKKAAVIIIIFAIFTIAICQIPVITEWDRTLIAFIQHKLNISQQIVSILTDKKLYNATIYIPIVIYIIYFAVKKLYMHIAVIGSFPFIAYWFNIIFKNIIARPRPPIELQIGTHSASFSYVSSHTITIMCLYGIIIFYTNKYCKNVVLKSIINVISVLYIILAGFFRILLGVHNPTDVLGAYILGALFIIISIETANAISKRYEQ